MKMNLALLGLFLALLSAPVASDQAVAGAALAVLEETCSPSDGSDTCPANTYCNGLTSTCLDIGACVDAMDCDEPNNQPLVLAMCIGTKTCEGGSCGMDCVETCASHTDCSSERYEQYCASDGICEPIGGCANAADCDVAVTLGMPIPMCMGGMECNNRSCEMDCWGGSDALFACTTAVDCPGKDQYYCNQYGTCREIGACNSVEDCSNADNFFMAIECEGRFTCIKGQCGKECGDFPEEEIASCTTSKGCEAEDEYCASNGICRESGACNSVEDCSNADNFFMAIACEGRFTCIEGQCGKECVDFPEDVLVEDPVSVTVVEDASGASLPEFTKEGNDGTANSIGIMSCTSDADCITTSSVRSSNAFSDGQYCAQGVCTNQGSCLSDMDCINPSNILWGDKKCMGYLHCTDIGTCDRVCGEDCKNGSRAAQCFANACDVGPECPGSVSCRMSTCDEACKANYFDAAGNIATCSDETSNVEKTIDATSNGEKTIDATSGSTSKAGAEEVRDQLKPQDPTTQILSLESSAFRATSFSALLVAVLVALIV